MLLFRTFSSFFYLFKVRFCIPYAIDKKNFHLNKSSLKQHSLKLLPNVEKLLESGNMKHRKHPGVRKMSPIVLPPKLISSMNKVISKENEKNLLNEAAVLLNFLSSRRLPVEKEEIDLTVEKFLHSIGDMPEELTKEQLIQLRRKIKSETNRWKPIEYNYHQCLAYLVGRLAPNYASIMRVFSEIKSHDVTFKPKAFFDFGSGVGSAIWAANASWGESLEEYFCVDAAPEMNDLSQTLLTDENTDNMLIKNLYYRQFLPASDSIKYDLVVSAFSLIDLPTAEDRLRVIDTLWRKTNDILVIIEFGNFAGFFSVLDARDYILHIENQELENVSRKSTGAHILLPCPHEFSCPMLEVGTKRSCGFHVSYETLFPRHRTVCKKDWISCVVLRKGHRSQDTPSWPRIVKPVLKRSKHVHCRVCCSDGKINELIVTKARHSRHVYRCARSSTLGDSLPLTIEPSTTAIECQEPLHHLTIEPSTTAVDCQEPLHICEEEKT